MEGCRPFQGRHIGEFGQGFHGIGHALGVRFQIQLGGQGKNAGSGPFAAKSGQSEGKVN